MSDPSLDAAFASRAASWAPHLVSPHPAVGLEHVSRQFGETTALVDVSLEIRAGETVALLGPNGAGKSTAIGIMLGLLEPTGGSARTMGLAPREAVRSGRVGAMLQGVGLPPGASVGELVDLARRLHPHPTPREAVLGRAGLAEIVRRRAETLSGGEAQRVRFAMAIAGDPNLVFLDEPTVAMDVESRRAFWDDMRGFAAEGRTVLFATHYLDEADQVADRIVVLDHGLIVANGSATDLKRIVRERTVQFAWPGADVASLRHLPGVIRAEVRGEVVNLVSADADATVRALVEAEVPFRNLEVVGPSLDAAFLALTRTATAAA